MLTQSIKHPHVWPCRYCNQWRETRDGIMWHEHADHGDPAPRPPKELKNGYAKKD